MATDAEQGASEDQRIAKAFIFIGQAWLWLAGAIIFASYALIWYFRGFSALQEIAHPMNFTNTIVVLITLAPGWALLEAGKRLQRRQGSKQGPN